MHGRSSVHGRLGWSIRDPPVRYISIEYTRLNTNAPCGLSRGREGIVMDLQRLHAVVAACALAPLLPLHAVAANNVVANPICTDNTANFNPTLPPSIVL